MGVEDQREELERVAFSSTHTSPNSVYLKENKEGQADSQEEPELLREVVVMGVAVVSVPGVGRNLRSGVRSSEGIHGV